MKGAERGQRSQGRRAEGALDLKKIGEFRFRVVAVMQSSSVQFRDTAVTEVFGWGEWLGRARTERSASAAPRLGSGRAQFWVRSPWVPGFTLCLMTEVKYLKDEYKMMPAAVFKK